MCASSRRLPLERRYYRNKEAGEAPFEIAARWKFEIPQGLGSFQFGDEPRDQRRPRHKRRDQDVFLVRVCATSHKPEAIQSSHTHGSGEVAIRSAAMLTVW
jgi:hypothetical protein